MERQFRRPGAGRVSAWGAALSDARRWFISMRRLRCLRATMLCVTINRWPSQISILLNSRATSSARSRMVVASKRYDSDSARLDICHSEASRCLSKQTHRIWFVNSRATLCRLVSASRHGGAAKLSRDRGPALPFGTPRVQPASSRSSRATASEGTSSASASILRNCRSCRVSGSMARRAAA